MKHGWLWVGLLSGGIAGAAFAQQQQQVRAAPEASNLKLVGWSDLQAPSLPLRVTRPSVVRVQALDRTGKSMDFEATGLYAVCIQHEMDHLIGKLFLDRMTDMSTLTQLPEFDKYWRHDPVPAI